MGLKQLFNRQWLGFLGRLGVAIEIGVGLGMLMIEYNATQYEVLFSTTSMFVSFAIVYSQQRQYNKDVQIVKKSWQINLGLVEGYDGGKEHPIESVYEAFKDWLIKRQADSQKLLSDRFSSKWSFTPTKARSLSPALFSKVSCTRISTRIETRTKLFKPCVI